MPEGIAMGTGPANAVGQEIDTPETPADEVEYSYLDEKLKKLIRRRVKRGAELLKSKDGTLSYVANIVHMDDAASCALAEREKFLGETLPAANYWNGLRRLDMFGQTAKAVSHGFNAPDFDQDYPPAEALDAENEYFDYLGRVWKEYA